MRLTNTYTLVATRDLDTDRSAKQRWHEGSEYAICTKTVGREDEAKYKRCKDEVLRKHREGK